MKGIVPTKFLEETKNKIRCTKCNLWKNPGRISDELSICVRCKENV